ncbi:hypothetical protein ACRAWG_34570 [Methylobacterium sp. P31]
MSIRMNKLQKEKLLRAAREFGTPIYVYDGDELLTRCRQLRRAFGNAFGVSYAVKANPNIALLRQMAAEITHIDVSSYSELERAIRAGYEPARITFSGPAKRPQELRGRSAGKSAASFSNR